MTILDSARVVRVLQEKSERLDRKEILQLSADEIRRAGEPYTSVYLYMLHGDELVLEAFSGRQTEHQKIKVGRGVCGAAVAEGKDQVVPDVKVRDDYIACNLFTRSELVVLVRRGDEIVGQIDIDSDVVDPFDQGEVQALRSVADALGKLL